jgi:1,4-alpha-glucan branching enzyme
MNGTFSLMLHAHIPYCRKSGVWPAGEEWLFEAMNETYIPLLSILRRFQMKNIKPRIMIGIVPILAEQLADPYMIDKFCVYMEDKIKRAEKDIIRFSDDAKKKQVAAYWRDRFQSNYESFKTIFFKNLMGTFKWLQSEGIIEVLTSAATHGFLPLLQQDSAVFTQIHTGIKTYEKYFGKKPKGFWLPECAYRYKEKGRRAIDEWLADEGIQFFFAENIGIERAEFIENKYHEEKPTTYSGYRLESGVCVFGRNQITGKQVWSPQGGYPGDPYYREFHSKDSESGLQYWRITGEDNKQVYEPEKAMERAKTHASHFYSLVTTNLKSIEQSNWKSKLSPIIVSPYDCELFGHWWHEGVDWIEHVYERFSKQSSIQTITLSEYINEFKEDFSIIRMGSSTWGENGDFTVWNNPEHAWLWPYINASGKDMEYVMQMMHDTNRKNLTDRNKRILKQLVRELLLMEGSDWPFLLHTKQAKEYANQRFHNHHQRFNKLLWAAKDLDDLKRISEHDLLEMEDIDNPWNDIDFNVFKKHIPSR